MVSFQSLQTVLSKNPNGTVNVPNYRLLPQPIVESFKLPTIRIAPDVIPRAVSKIRASSPVHSVRSVHSDASDDALPPPTRMLPVAAKVAVAVAVEPLVSKVVVPSVDVPETSTTNGDIQRTRFLDPICLAIERTDAMYSIANRNVQQTLECEEARRLEARISELYKEESGRSRGWVKTKLEAFFLPRAAVGSRVASKDAFVWEKIWTDKEASAVLDFICLAKGIRLAVWKDSEKVIGLWPAADSGKLTGSIPLINVGNVGKCSIHGAIQQGWRIVAPLSVEKGLEKLTLDELDGLAEKMGITIPSGKKTEKVCALASARMLLRIK
jgi:hypothetical protein